MISVFTFHPSHRLTYVLDFVFVERLGIPYIVINDPTEIANLSYGLSPATISIPAVGWLEKGFDITSSSAHTVLVNTLRWLERDEEPIPDIFATIFWFLSRHEEYQIENRDEHGRFTSTMSLAGKLGCLQRPIVDEIVAKLISILKEKLPQLSTNIPIVQHLSTIDIDQPWAYAHKGFKVVLGAIKAKIEGDDIGFALRKKSFISAYDDPYFTFVELESWHDELGITPQYFVLSSDNQHPLDVNHPIDQTATRSIIRSLDRGDNMGLHPSYHSHTSLDILRKEKLDLETSLEHVITKSRQHYLKFNLPDTYRNLVTVEMNEDHSMGYADAIGYRAGTGHRFYWYDIENDIQTTLRVFPLIIMDMTLKKYMQLSPTQAHKLCQNMVKNANALGSPVTILWHNSSLSEIDAWTPWISVYRDLLKSISQSI